MMTVIEGWQMR